MMGCARVLTDTLHLSFACTDDYGNLTGYVLYESVEQAQRAELTFNEEESMFKVSAKRTQPL